MVPDTASLIRQVGGRGSESSEPAVDPAAVLSDELVLQQHLADARRPHLRHHRWSASGRELVHRWVIITRGWAGGVVLIT